MSDDHDERARELLGGEYGAMSAQDLAAALREAEERGEARGEEKERARIVAWLRERSHAASIDAAGIKGKFAASVRNDLLVAAKDRQALADDIARLAHHELPATTRTVEDIKRDMRARLADVPRNTAAPTTTKDEREECGACGHDFVKHFESGVGHGCSICSCKRFEGTGTADGKCGTCGGSRKVRCGLSICLPCRPYRADAEQRECPTPRPCPVCTGTAEGEKR